MVELSDPVESDLGRHVRRGLGWKAASEATLFASRIVVAVVLARLLTPEDFGIAGMVLVLSAFVVTFADFGLGNALVQRATLSEADRSTMFWTAVALGTFLTIAGALAAGLVARFYGESEVRLLFLVLSLSFVVTAVGATQRSLLSRAMDFRSLELRTIVSFIAGAVAAIVLAAAGAGAWALVVQSLTILTVSTLLLWALVPWRPALTFSWASLRDLGGFGARSLGGSTFTILNEVTDKLLIGRVLGATPLGFYVLASSVILQPLTRIVTPVQQVLYPALSRLQHDRTASGAAWLRSLRALTALCAPLMVVVIVTAPDAVPFAFGDRWTPAASVLQILGWVGIMQCLQGLSPVALQALGRPGAWFALAAATYVFNLAALVAGVAWGIRGAATALAISTTAGALLSTVVVARTLGVGLGRVATGLAGVAFAVTAMAAAGQATRLFLLELGAGEALRLALVGIVSAVVFLAAAALDRELFAELRGVLRLRSARVRARADPARP